MSEPALVVDDISVSYGNIPALRNVSLEVSEGEVVGVIGNNGAGKSTLLSTIAGVLKPVDGDIRLNGTSIAGRKPEQIVRKHIALVPEDRRIFPHLTVEENLVLGASAARRGGQMRETMEEVMEYFPVLARYSNASASGLSGGEQQQLAIGRALMSRPRILMLDEPSLGLAPRIIDTLFEMLGRLQHDRGTTLLLVEQNVVRTLEFAHRVYTLRTGEIEFSGEPAELRAMDDFETQYLGMAG